MKKNIAIILILALLSLGVIKLPKILKVFRTAQIQLLIKSRASKWGKPWTPR